MAASMSFMPIIVTGIPAGLRLDKDNITKDLRRRQHGNRNQQQQWQQDAAKHVYRAHSKLTVGACCAFSVVALKLSRTGRSL